MRQFIRWARGLLRFNSRLDRKTQVAREVIELVLPSRPQVAAHQRSAALHLQLAEEIGWQGPRFRHPQSWRGR